MSYVSTGFGTALTAAQEAQIAEVNRVREPNAVDLTYDCGKLGMYFQRDTAGPPVKGHCEVQGEAIVPATTLSTLDKVKAFWSASLGGHLPLVVGAALVLGVLWMAMRGGKVPAAATANRIRYRANAGRGNWALVRTQGMDDWILSFHKTKEAAENAMRKRGGEPDSMFQSGMHIEDVGPSSRREAVQIFGKWTTRPRSAQPNRRRRTHPILVTATSPKGVRVTRRVSAWEIESTTRRMRHTGWTNIKRTPTVKMNSRRNYHENRRSSRRCSPLKRRVKTCHCSPPKKYVRMGARRRSDYAFGECFMYPLRFRTKSGKIKLAVTRKHIGQAAQRFSMHRRRYPRATRERIGWNIIKAKRYYGVGR